MITETNQNKINLTESEWQLKEETRKLLEVRENAGNQDVTGLAMQSEVKLVQCCIAFAKISS